MRTIIAGGRAYSLTEADRAWLDRIRERLPITVVLSGAARGADTDGADWATSRGIPVETYPADWDRHGRAAGPLRNQEMVDRADALVPFPGTSGTADVTRRAHAAGLLVVAVPRPAKNRRGHGGGEEADPPPPASGAVTDPASGPEASRASMREHGADAAVRAARKPNPIAARARWRPMETAPQSPGAVALLRLPGVTPRPDDVVLGIRWTAEMVARRGGDPREVGWHKLGDYDYGLALTGAAALTPGGWLPWPSDDPAPAPVGAPGPRSRRDSAP